MKEKISVQSFVEEFINKKITNNKLNEHAITDFIREKLDIIEYIPFLEKRQIVEMVVFENTDVIDGIKKIDSISQYLSFVCVMIEAHTNLKISDNPAEDYDALYQSGLLELIVDTFRADYLQCDTLLKMTIASQLEDNNVNVIVGRFLNGLLAKFDNLGEVLERLTKNIDLTKILGEDFKKEDIAKIIGFADKINK